MCTIVVLGMHRSGTSMLAGILSRLGVDMGRRLVCAHWSNPLGHYENIEFVRLNRKILEKAGGSWDFPPRESRILALSKDVSLDIQDLIKREQRNIWGWKDPQTALVIELYLPYLKNPYFLICHRDIFSIARSLKERNGMMMRQGIRLANIYEERIFLFFQRHPELKRIDLAYEGIIDSPQEWVRKIINFLRITPTDSQYKDSLNFILPRQEIEKRAVKMRAKERLLIRIFKEINRENLRVFFCLTRMNGLGRTLYLYLLRFLQIGNLALGIIQRKMRKR